jgi:hypothetical protein
VTTAVVASASSKAAANTKVSVTRPRPTWLEIIWCYFRY